MARNSTYHDEFVVCVENWLAVALVCSCEVDLLRKTLILSHELCKLCTPQLSRMMGDYVMLCYVIVARRQSI